MAKNFEQVGNTLTVAESTLTHIDSGDGLVNSGEPCTFGAGDQFAGIAQIDAVATTTQIPVLRKGVHRLAVTGRDQVPADSAVAVGDALYIDVPEGQINKDGTLGVLLGYALGTVGAGLTATIPVMMKDG
ncbi:hypothetical protein LCGC14_0630330 [marine sediment metagenome]|uniref:DUF2190 domain-containing protein n=1 Tax=marine sediment metagenome TaxID=412755 RepID=A0A0F9R7D9_9ZZZZ